MQPGTTATTRCVSIGCAAAHQPLTPCASRHLSHLPACFAEGRTVALQPRPGCSPTCLPGPCSAQPQLQRHYLSSFSSSGRHFRIQRKAASAVANGCCCAWEGEGGRRMSQGAPLFSIVVFGSIVNEGYLNHQDESEEFCIFNRNQDACGYGITVGVLAFLSCLLYLALDVYFPQISSVKDRKKVVLSDIGVSGEFLRGLVLLEIL
ncbi:UNVERIFIED_CONTAM: hypothetical protein K2H54_074624 [Gekko kuhli]